MAGVAVARTGAKFDNQVVSTFSRGWGVARTIAAGKQDDTFRLLKGQLSRFLSSDEPAAVVQELAEKLQKRGFGARGGRPTSLVSKFAYHLRPDSLAPRDGFAFRGLRAIHRGGLSSYVDYVNAFDKEFRRYKPAIVKECRRPWVRSLVQRLKTRFRPGFLETSKFHRKVFDNLLSMEGGRWSLPGKARNA